MINIAVMGYGTVGSGVVEVIDTNGERIAQRTVSYTHLTLPTILRV